MDFLRELFKEDYWESYYRKIDDDRPNKSNWHKLIVPRRYWCADPFIVEERGIIYVFCEMMDRKISRGLIGCAQLNLDGDTKVKPILNLGCHTSYPNVFKYKEKWYMIPETSARKTIELYYATKFPFEWIKVNNLLEDKFAVDTTVFTHNGEIYLFIYEPNGYENSLSIAHVDMTEKRITNIRKVLQYTKKIGRPAGNVILEHGKQIRPTQYGVNHYGEAMVFKEFSFDTKSFSYDEKDVIKLGPTDLLPLGLSKNKTGCHTVNRCLGYEIIDVYKNRLYIEKPINTIFKILNLFGYKSYS